VALEPIRNLVKKPERLAGQAGGILKYRRLFLLDSYFFSLVGVNQKVIRMLPVL